MHILEEAFNRGFQKRAEVLEKDAERGDVLKKFLAQMGTISNEEALLAKIPSRSTFGAGQPISAELRDSAGRLDRAHPLYKSVSEPYLNQRLLAHGARDLQGLNRLNYHNNWMRGIDMGKNTTQPADLLSALAIKGYNNTPIGSGGGTIRRALGLSPELSEQVYPQKYMPPLH